MKWLKLALPFLTILCIGADPTQNRPWISCSVSPFVTPGHPIALACAARDGAKRYRADLIRLSFDQAAAQARNETIGESLAGPTASIDLIAGTPSGTLQGRFDAPPIGVYAIHVTEGDRAGAWAYADVASVGLMAMTAGQTDLLAPVVLDDDRIGDPGATVWTLRGKGYVAATAAADGTFRPVSDSLTAHFGYVKASDGSLAFASWWQYGSAFQPPVFMQTDRPVYRPGDEVQVHAVLRKGVVGAYRIDRDPVVLSVAQGYSNRTIALRKLQPDNFGAVATSLRLPSDTPLGPYRVSVNGIDRGGFAVEAYRKPEYVLEMHPSQLHPLGGASVTFAVHVAYLFGAPASGMRLQYEGAIYGIGLPPFGPFSGLIPMRRPYPVVGPRVSGTLVTDAQGDATISVPTTRERYQRTLTLTVDARDESGRTISSQSSVPVEPATFALTLAPRTWYGQVHATSTVDITARRYDGPAQPRAHVHLAIAQLPENRPAQQTTIDRGTADLTTDAAGKASFSFVPPAPGTYRFDATATDERGNVVEATQYQWVVSPNSAWAPPVEQPRLISQQDRFAAGTPIHVLLAQQTSHDALVVVSSDRVLEVRVLHAPGVAHDIVVTPPPGVEHLRVAAFVAEPTGLASAETDVNVDPAPTTLHVAVVPAQARYQPGQEASFRLHVTDARGRPARAQITLGVVDRGIYAIAADTADPRAPFYARVVYASAFSDWAAPNRPLKMLAFMAARQSTNGAPAPEAVTIANVHSAVRATFLDTAYWAPAVDTDAHGNATVHFTWPDNVTTWTSTATAFSKTTQIGRATTDTLVTKDFLVRLETPRFLRAGDRAQLTGIAHGESPGTPVSLQLQSPQLAVDARRSTVLDGDRRASASWPVTVPGIGDAEVTLRGSDAARSDAMRITLPLLGGTPLEHVRDAGRLESTAVIPTPLDAGEMPGELQLSFSPSLLAELAQTLRAFDVYPYYCTEQTGSNGLVAAALYAASLPATGMNVPGNPRAVIARARARLDDLEHADGGWGWWNADPSNAFMTAYAVWALHAMDATNADPMQEPRIARGVTWLTRDLAVDTKLGDDDRALALYAIALADPRALPAPALDAMSARIDRFDATATALSGLAAKAAGRDDVAQRAVARLHETSMQNGGERFWRDGDWSYEWWSDPVGATSYAAMLFETVHDRTDLDGALAFLRAQRNGDWWYTTADTAAAATALAEAESAPAIAATNETVKVTIGGRVVRTIAITSALPDASQTHVVIPALALQSHEPVTIERSGAGLLYWSSDFSRYLNRNATSLDDANEGLLKRLFAAPPALAVNRRYTVDHPGPWRVGDVVTVDLWISAAHGARYVTLEDPFPAGVEYQPLQGDGAWSSWSGVQFLDDRAAFFIAWLSPGDTDHVQYRLRATTAGTFAAPGPSAYASYGPPVKTAGTGEEVEIR